MWLESDRPKTLHSLGDVFAEKGFAILFLILMSVPALPLPTGGLTHVFEVIVMLLALELIIGRQTVWMPKRWGSLSIGTPGRTKALKTIVKIVRFFEKFSRPRLRSFLQNRIVLGCIGTLVLIFSLTAFLAPPFSGLDTLPALGIVLMALALMLDDIIVLIAGLLVGSVGIAVVIGLGVAVTTFFRGLL